MRNPHAHDQMPPQDWATAFAALPPEAPPADALSSVFARLPASTPARPRRQWWIAAAAVLALAAVVPLAMNVARHSGAGEPRNAGIASTRHSGASRNPVVALQKPTPGTRPQGPREAVGSRRDDGFGTAAVRSGVATPEVAMAPVEHSTPVRIAKTGTHHRKPDRTHKSVPASEPADALMEPLYAESARLEALLALARDDRVASASAVALGSDFEARLSAIDAALAQPALTPRRRLELWRERVSALRAYAGFESTRRALAASGERYDAMLVSID
ncbi:MAG: hypothetical protein U1F20_01390 [Lysobacterales bacterium]